MMNKYLLAALVSMIISSLAQVLLKKSSGEKKKSVIFEYLNIKVITAYFMTSVSMLLVIYTFKGINYKYGTVIESLAYLPIMLFSRLFLKEKITMRKILGNTAIIAGAIIFTMNF